MDQLKQLFSLPQETKKKRLRLCPGYVIGILSIILLQNYIKNPDYKSPKWYLLMAILVAAPILAVIDLVTVSKRVASKKESVLMLVITLVKFLMNSYVSFNLIKAIGQNHGCEIRENKFVKDSQSGIRIFLTLNVILLLICFLQIVPSNKVSTPAAYILRFFAVF